MMDHENTGDYLPRKPIDRLVGPIQRFLHVEAASGVVLLLCTIVALILANSRFGDGYLGIWKTQVGFRLGSFEMFHSLKHWINDGLMAIFFFVVGLEVKRELVLGELREFRRAALPIAAALGGMIVPAAVYFALQTGDAGARGWGIPMATDIAFVVGCMAILGPRIPPILRVVLLSLAIVDDIGAILVIAIGYTEGLSAGALVLGFAGIGVVFVLQRLGVRSFGVYTVVGALVWLAFHESGVHATIAGVILGLMTPARSFVSQNVFARLLRRADEVVHGDWEAEPHRAEKLRAFQWAARETVSPLEYLETGLHPLVGFVIMPVFALANAGVLFEPADFGSPIAVAVMAGLVIGKPVGIMLFSWAAVRLGLKSLPQGLGWRTLFGGACLAGIGFTMALFISELALDGDALDAAKVGVLGASAISAVLGMSILIAVSNKQTDDDKSGT
jgi:NhaA family Na+:H+ antiporter